MICQCQTHITLSIYLSIYISICLSVYLSNYLSSDEEHYDDLLLPWSRLIKLPVTAFNGFKVHYQIFNFPSNLPRFLLIYTKKNIDYNTFLPFYRKCNFPTNPIIRLSVGWLVLSVCRPKRAGSYTSMLLMDY